MTGKQLRTRLVFLLSIAAGLIVMHSMIYILRNVIATPFIPEFVAPQSAELAREHQDKCSNLYYSAIADCSRPVDEVVRADIAERKRRHVYWERSKLGDDIDEGGWLVFGTAYAIVVGFLLWAFKQWFQANYWSSLANAAQGRWAAIRSPERRSGRRLQQLDAEFSALTRLKEGGLLSPDEFERRKAAIATRIAVLERTDVKDHQ